MNFLDEHELQLAAEALLSEAKLLESVGRKWEAAKRRLIAEKLLREKERREAEWFKNRFQEVMLA